MKKKALLVYSRWQYGGPPTLSNFCSNLTGSFEYFAQNNPEYEVENVYIGTQSDEINSTAQLSNVLLNKEYDIALVSEINGYLIEKLLITLGVKSKYICLILFLL